MFNCIFYKLFCYCIIVIFLYFCEFVRYIVDRLCCFVGVGYQLKYCLCENWFVGVIGLIY